MTVHCVQTGFREVGCRQPMVPRQRHVRLPEDVEVSFSSERTLVDGRSPSDERGLRGGRREARTPYAWGEEIGGRLVGLLGVTPSGDEGVRIRWLRVDPVWGNAAIVSKLIRNLRDHCRGRGYANVRVDASLAPGWVWRQFQRRGFRMCPPASQAASDLHFVLDFYAD